MLVLALFCALLAGFTPALAQGASGSETLVIHRMDVRNASIDLGDSPPTIVIDYDIEDVSEDDMDVIAVRSRSPPPLPPG